MQHHFEQFMGKQRRLEGKYFGVSEAKPLRFDCVNQSRAQFSLIYEFKTYRISSRPVIP